jgi:hypothetical protein
VGLEVVVAEGPVGQGRPLDGPALGQEGEVLFPEARELAVGVGPAAADRGREVVHVADEEAVAVGVAQAERAGLEEGVRPEEVADHELDLVVGVVAEELRRVVEVDEVVAALLEEAHRPAGLGQHVGDRGASGAGSDDDGVEVGRAHGRLTSSSVQPRGCTSPAQSM